MPKLPSRPFYFFYYYHLILTASILSLGLLPSVSAFAKLPPVVQNALTQVGLQPDNISVIIMPVGSSDQNGQPNSQLPTPVLPEADTQALHAQTSTSDNKTESYLKDDRPAPADYKPTLPASVADAPISESTDIETKDPAQTNIRPPKPLPAAITHYPNTPRTPASTMKLVPTFIALDTLGEDFVWQTRVYYSGLRVGSMLYGDLIIQGSGDPKLTADHLRQLLNQVNQAGISDIHGDIIIDTSVFNHVTKDPAAFDNDPLRPYNASPDGFLVNFSSIEIKSYPESSQKAQLIYSPKLADYHLPSTIGVRQGRCRRARYSLSPKWGSQALSFERALPSGCAEHSFYVAYPDAKGFATRVVAALWAELGNSLSGRVVAQDTPSQQPAVSPLPIVSYPSHPLSRLIYDINHHSNNVMTEQVTLSIPIYHHTNQAPPLASDLAAPHFQTKRPTTPSSLYYQHPTSDYPLALAAIRHWWQHHLSTPPPHMTNGSGLCRDCSLTAAGLAELLKFAYSQPEFDTFVHSLGVAGISGTIAEHSNRLPNSQAIGRAWIKTGTLSNVTAMAGYVKGHSGQDYVVVGIINTQNKLNTYSARQVLDKMLDWTAQQ